MSVAAGWVWELKVCCGPRAERGMGLDMRARYVESAGLKQNEEESVHQLNHFVGSGMIGIVVVA